MKTFIQIFLLMVYSVSSAQEMLSVDEAIKIALKNNFEILIAGNNAEIANINNTAGNAGMLPELHLAGSGSYEVNNVYQRLTGGSENRYPVFTSALVNAGAELSWTLFDGGKMFITKNKLSQIEALGELQFREQVLQTQYEVIAAYFDVVRQMQQLKSINEVLNLNSERVIIAQKGFDSGMLQKSDLLQAQIDLNLTRENIIIQEYAIELSQKKLLLLMGLSDDTRLNLSDSIKIEFIPIYADLNQKMIASNAGILSLQKQVDIAGLSLEENRRNFFPRINFNAGYYLMQSVNSDGSVLENFSIGPQIGGSLIIPLYSSGENKRKTSAARVQLKSAEYQLENYTLSVSAELKNTINDFENQKKLLLIEEQNNLLTKENLVISMHRLELGEATSLEVRQAQEDYMQSCTRLINFRYNLKLSETRLKQLVNDI